MTRWGFTVDLKRCIGCYGCVEACKTENGTPPEIFWMKVYKRNEDELKASWPFIPTRCNHCENAPCATACPTGATHQRGDGIVVIDYDQCIGCEACIIACPYQANSLWFHGEGYYGTELTPYEEQVYDIGRRKGTAQKCTFCHHRLDRGMDPACVETCPTDALNCGDLDNPETEINHLINTRDYFLPHEELGTKPKLFYLT